MALALAVGAASVSQAADFDFGTHMKDAFKVFDAKRDNAENPYLQELSLKLRGQYQWGYLDPAGGDDRVKGNRNDNNEWRRFRLGAQAKAPCDFCRYKGICRRSENAPFVEHEYFRDKVFFDKVKGSDENG